MLTRKDHEIFLSTLVLSLFCPILCNLTGLSLQGKPTSQSSTLVHFGVPLPADLATDGDHNTVIDHGENACAHTEETESHPWWKVDLQTTHCIGKITILNRGECCNERLAGTVLRVGFNADILQNAVCGLPVTLDQAAVPGGWVVIECTPAVAGRYVSADIDHGSGAVSALTLCEVMVEEYDLDVCRKEQDSSFITSSDEFKLVYEGRCSSHLRPLAIDFTKLLLRCAMQCKRNIMCETFEYTTLGQCRLYRGQVKDLEPVFFGSCSIYSRVKKLSLN